MAQVAEDGTPIADILEHNHELAAEMAELKRRLRAIHSLCLVPLSDWTKSRRQQVLDLTKTS